MTQLNLLRELSGLTECQRSENLNILIIFELQLSDWYIKLNDFKIQRSL